MNISQVHLNTDGLSYNFQSRPNYNSSLIAFGRADMVKLEKLLMKNEGFVDQFIGKSAEECASRFKNDKWAQPIYNLLESALGQVEKEYNELVMMPHFKQSKLLKPLMVKTRNLETRLYDANYILNNPLERDFAQNNKLFTRWKGLLGQTQSSPEEESFRIAEKMNEYLVDSYEAQYNGLNTKPTEEPPLDRLNSVFSGLIELKKNLKIFSNYLTENIPK